MATWFSDPKFLDGSGQPLPLSVGAGANSISHLIRASGAKIENALAIQLMRQSPCIKFASDGRLIALKRAFLLHNMEVPRAAFIVERYLDTVMQIALDRKKGQPLLLERSSQVSEFDLAKSIPMLRDLASRGAAFLDSVDGDLEGCRVQKSKRMNMGDLGIHIFVWKKPIKQKIRYGKRRNRSNA
jgi:hypothetical protein